MKLSDRTIGVMLVAATMAIFVLAILAGAQGLFPEEKQSMKHDAGNAVANVVNQLDLLPLPVIVFTICVAAVVAVWALRYASNKK